MGPPLGPKSYSVAFKVKEGTSNIAQPMGESRSPSPPLPPLNTLVSINFFFSVIRSRPPFASSPLSP